MTDPSDEELQARGLEAAGVVVALIRAAVNDDAEGGGTVLATLNDEELIAVIASLVGLALEALTGLACLLEDTTVDDLVEEMLITLNEATDERNGGTTP